ERAVRLYSSIDAGKTWTSDLAPVPMSSPGGEVDQWTAIASSGKQYVVFLATTGARRLRVWVTSRADSSAGWGRPVEVAPSASPDSDDKPAMIITGTRLY